MRPRLVSVWRRRALAALAAGALVVAACSGDDDTAESAPPDPTPAAADAASAASGTTVRFSTADNQQLEGSLLGEGARGVVLAHMRGRDRSTWQPFAELAAGQGYHVLTFDFRGYGGSTGDRDTELPIDIAAAVGFLESQGAERVVVMGASMGGTAAINAATDLDLAGVVSLSAPANFQGIAARDVIDQVTEAVLLISAEDDEPYATAATDMAALAQVSQLQMFEGTAHGTNLFTTHDAALNQLLFAFLTNRMS